MRVWVLRLVALAAVVALAAFVFLGIQKTTGTAEAAGLSNLSCSFSTPLQPPPAPGTADTVTCTFDFNGTSYTLVVDFVFNMPPQVTGCTLNGDPIHVGPCP